MALSGCVVLVMECKRFCVVVKLNKFEDCGCFERNL